MKKIHSANNASEIYMLKDVLEERGIGTNVQGEHYAVEGSQNITLWVDNDEDVAKARAVISEFINDEGGESADLPKRHTSSSTSAFITGNLFGVFICILGMLIFNSLNKSGNRYPTSWDSNQDGKMDIWAEYSNGQLTKYTHDRNFDTAIDRWIYYENKTQSREEIDEDFDGKIDRWYYFKDGRMSKYSADNDRDGKIDEWGIVENGGATERNWSFANDKVVDKKAIYKNGRKTSESYDRDRDGSFDEVILLD
jgi:hypothetical protein